MLNVQDVEPVPVLMQRPKSRQTRQILFRMSVLHNTQYNNHMNTGLVWYSNERFVSGCQMVWYLDGGLKTRLKKLVYGLKCPVVKWSAKSRDFTI